MFNAKTKIKIKITIQGFTSNAFARRFTSPSSPSPIPLPKVRSPFLFRSLNTSTSFSVFYIYDSQFYFLVNFFQLQQILVVFFPIRQNVKHYQLWTRMEYYAEGNQEAPEHSRRFSWASFHLWRTHFAVYVRYF